jgi:hypothetical protein
MKNKILFQLVCLVFLMIPLLADAQERVWVYFKDKGSQLEKPIADYVQAHVSQRAVDRRFKRAQQPYFDYTDIPVKQEYINRLRTLGIQIYRKSKWLNAVSILRDGTDLDAVRKLPFVRKISAVRSHRFKEVIESEGPFLQKSSALEYGPSLNQNDMIGIPAAHAMGLTGQGVRIAMFDTGFLLEHESLQGIEVIDSYDFVQGDSIVANESGESPSQHNHGTLVLSTIGGYMPGQLIGPAYQAEYLLAKTEDISSERHVEEDNWVAAAEWADSLGADIISTSLGYSRFDFGEGNYTYEDMNGDSAIITKAADLAARKGILVFASAGNEGSSSWFYITAPADGDSVIAVGGVQPDGSIWAGSSNGPTFDGRIKPDIVAQGISVYSASPNSTNFYTRASGTSLACPLAAGAGAILLSLNPELEPMQIRDILRSTATQSENPDNTIGYGIINLENALQILDSDPIVRVTSFVAEAKQGRNLLQWIANIEIKNEYWIIRRQSGDSASEEVTRIAGNTFNLTPQIYTVSDLDLHGGETFLYTLWARYDDGVEVLLDSTTITSTTANSVLLMQSVPNPFNNSTRITFSLNKAEKVSIQIYDVQGRRVSTLLNNVLKEARFHSVNWSGIDDRGTTLASGMYYAVLNTSSVTQSIKLLLLR